MSRIHLRYWAGAETAAGTASETVDADTARQALSQANAARAGQPSAREFDRVLRASSLLIDGRRLDAAELDAPLADGVTVEVLPPFAGG